MRSIFYFLLLFVLVGCSSGSFEGKKDRVRYSLSELYDLVGDNGYNIKEKREHSIVFETEKGEGVNLYLMPDGDLLLVFSIKSEHSNIEVMNKWNKSKRLSRGYIDDEGDPVVESDLIMSRGMTKENVSEFINVFTKETIPAFINEYDG
ncbi:YbjN domain-containing protein [Escherichia albertii]|uniref:YbjN domain-containing protein n=1 Tax=Escherichia albertii TaxID=208962 RepID=A0ABX5HA04_ESCAL|nr:YbjN domain-containing protein [Escherichia albertii]MDY9122967.1 YbjN domain-containing protein [Escherichia coli]EJM1769890.1 YbjN domain-containing protein [Escherichia albertii]EJO0120228.1 YbjN domain-containing protein [Escherichia albertii]MCU7273758.1 YbjN domain-containing protein [Escherichia albertii]PSY34148.1 YbjN domain-containing protein [Escherichia albertii]